MSQPEIKRNNPHLLPLQEQWINMNIVEIKHLFIYYLFALFISLFWIIFSIIYHYELPEKGFSNMVGLLMFSFPSGVLGATIYYIRKLYKSCIQKLVIDKATDHSSEAEIRKFGAKVYFYIRPLFSGILAILASVAVIAGFFIVGDNPTVSDEKFFLFIVLLSFYIGFCNGKLILKMEQQGNDIINSIFKENKDAKK